jgi:hypothetical protein
MAKLTLSVDDRVVERAKQYAGKQGTSVSALVERYLEALTRPTLRRENLPPVVRRLHGVLRGAALDRADYLDYIERKYR